MDLKIQSAGTLLIISAIGLAGCSDSGREKCKPSDHKYCVDEHHLWQCDPDRGPDEWGTPNYYVNIIDCREVTRDYPYCRTEYFKNGEPRYSACRREPAASRDTGSDAVDGDATDAGD